MFYALRLGGTGLFLSTEADIGYALGHIWKGLEASDIQHFETATAALQHALKEAHNRKSSPGMFDRVRIVRLEPTRPVTHYQIVEPLV